MASVKQIINACMVLIMAVGMLGFMSGCARHEANYDYDQTIDFVAFKNYRWAEKDTTRSSDPRVKNDLLDARIRDSIDATLKSKSYIFSEEGNVDFLISYQVNIEKRTEADKFHTGVGFGYRYLDFGVHSDTIIREYHQIALYIDVFDPKTNKLIWRGFKDYRYHDGATVAERNQRVSEIVAVILSRFPPLEGSFK